MLKVELSQPQLLFVIFVVVIAPLLAGILLWKNARVAGGILLALSMAGAFVFGFYHHFVLISPDHVLHVPGIPGTVWVLTFQFTAMLLTLIEGLGIIAGVKTLKVNEASSG